MEIRRGNLFTSTCQTLVNTVNTAGVMGAGIALEYRLRYPDLYAAYVKVCRNRDIAIGRLWLYETANRKVLNFPTKQDWRRPSRLSYIEAGLKRFVDEHRSLGITSIAFPVLGADRGGIPEERSLELMKRHLEPLDLTVHIYRYDPTARDDLYERVKEWLLARDVREVAEVTGLRADLVAKVIAAVRSRDIVQLNQLGRVPGIGIRTLERIYAVAMGEAREPSGVQGRLL